MRKALWNPQKALGGGKSSCAFRHTVQIICIARAIDDETSHSRLVAALFQLPQLEYIRPYNTFTRVARIRAINQTMLALSLRVPKRHEIGEHWNCLAKSFRKHFATWNRRG